MKKFVFVLALLFFSTRIVAQFESSMIQPEVFRLTNLGTLYCPVSHVGFMYYYGDNINKLVYCAAANQLEHTGENWAVLGANSYYLGKVGIGVFAPTYDLDCGNTIRTQNAIINGNVGIGTTSPSEKLEVVNRPISISSTADTYSWRIANSDASNRLNFLDNGQPTTYINYGGNISIGSVSANNTHKLYVDGGVSYASNLTVEGKGTLSNTNANQLVMTTVTSVATGGIFSVLNNGCNTATFSFTGSIFTAPPAVFLGQNLSSQQFGEALTKSIENVTTTSGQIRFCNNTGTDITFGNQTFSLIAIGQ